MSKATEIYAASLFLDTTKVSYAHQDILRKGHVDQIRPEIDAILKKDGGKWIYDATDYGSPGKEGAFYSTLVFEAPQKAADEIQKLPNIVYGDPNPILYALGLKKPPKKSGPKPG